MDFKPKTEKEISEENLMPKGTYPFDVFSAEPKTSQAGNPMIELELRVYMPDGRERRLRDWLMPAMAFKLFHFCAYCGLSKEYDAGTLKSTDCMGKSGYVKIGIQADKMGQYPDRNNVLDYVRPDYKAGASSIAMQTPVTAPSPARALPGGGPDENIDEDVPF